MREDRLCGRRPPPEGDLELDPLPCSGVLLRAPPGRACGRTARPPRLELLKESVALGCVLGPNEPLRARLSRISARKVLSYIATRKALIGASAGRLSSEPTHDFALLPDDSHESGIPGSTAAKLPWRTLRLRYRWRWEARTWEASSRLGTPPSRSAKGLSSRPSHAQRRGSVPCVRPPQKTDARPSRRDGATRDG